MTQPCINSDSENVFYSLTPEGPFSLAGALAFPGKKLPSDNISFLSAADRSEKEASIKEKYWPHIRAKGYFLIVKPYVREEKSSGGVILPGQTRDEDQHHSVAAQVIDVGPMAYTDAKYAGHGAWAQIGDWVVIPRISGTRVILKKTEDAKKEIMFRIVSEDDIIATISDPEEWQIRFSSTKF